ncbi:SDR family oxidoreductase [Salinicoccus halitifaciens]|uniref:NAD(P)-dependent dehydrogenase (Short-subunit alcohol dehydrogenase family) n=1 Tax=Salinicoccus halitifaciens TaxID=1073415 RepID=A0ABV2EBE6_9STAP|nr:SDR family oxidoreductase [Salinicoccus halitifaciens]MCD2138939.1 SDR family oxidoreductase [Salinicoccus halitifaciens]
MNNEKKYEAVNEQVEGYTQDGQPGIEKDMDPKPVIIADDYKGSGKLEGKVALITGGDSGIGRSVAVHFAKEGADIALLYLEEEEEDAQYVKMLAEKENVKCLLYSGNINDADFRKETVNDVVSTLGTINILVNNAGVQYPKKDFLDITEDNLRETFETNIISMILLTQEVFPHLEEGDSIINSTSVTAYKGSPIFIDYSSTKGAITSFTRSLAQNLAPQKIRVNAVAPGPIYTPLIPATFDAEHVDQHGEDTPMERRGQPAELGPSYVFLAAQDSSYMTGEVLHVNGGDFTAS